jgi:hypothetical protein
MSSSTETISATGASDPLEKNANENISSLQVSGTFTTAAFTLEGSLDGTNYAQVFCFDSKTGTPVAGGTTLSPSNSTTTQWTIPNAAGYVKFRLNVSTLASGALVAKLYSQQSFASNPYNVSSGSAGAFTTLTSTGAITSSSATAGVGYATGAGGTVTQGTSRTTGVTLNTACGNIVLYSAAGSATPFSFTLTNSAIAAGDSVVISQKSGTDKYTTQVVTAVAAGSCQITLANASGTTTEQPVFNFAVIKGVAA